MAPATESSSPGYGFQNISAALEISSHSECDRSANAGNIPDITRNYAGNSPDVQPAARPPADGSSAALAPAGRTGSHSTVMILFRRPAGDSAVSRSAFSPGSEAS